MVAVSMNPGYEPFLQVVGLLLVRSAPMKQHVSHRSQAQRLAIESLSLQSHRIPKPESAVPQVKLQ